MTLKQFLSYRLLHDNVVVCEFIPDSIGLGEIVELVHLKRNPGLASIEKLIGAGLDSKYLEYSVCDFYGTKLPYTTQIVITKYE